MYLLTSEKTLKISGGCSVIVAGYQFDPVGVDCGYAQIIANMYNYDFNTSGLIGYQHNGYAKNPYHAESVAYPLGNIAQYHLFNKAMKQVVPFQLIA